MSLLAALVLSVALSACSDEPDGPVDPDKPDTPNVNPNTPVADPTGTISLSMRNDDETSLDGLLIGEDDNFHGSGWMLASVGKVNGLGNVVDIPAAGWTNKLSVIPGNGYVAFNSYEKKFYRIFVEDYITAAVSGGVIGANVKYQRPFYGVDEALNCPTNSISFTNEPSAQGVVFENKSIIVFSAESDQGWCQVNRASSREQDFLYDGVVIECEMNTSTQPRTATITLETGYHRTTTISVTQAGSAPFLTLPIGEEFSTDASAFSETLAISSNVDASTISVKSDSDWLAAEMANQTRLCKRAIRWIEGRQPTRAGGYDNAVAGYFTISAGDNISTEARTANVAVCVGSQETVLKVTQRGGTFTWSESSIEVGAGANTCGVKFFTTFDSNLWEAESSVDWIKIDRIHQETIGIEKRFSLSLNISDNDSESDRKGKVVFKSKMDGTTIGTLFVTQKGLPVFDVTIYFDRNASNKVTTILFPASTEIICSASWLTASRNGNSVTIRATAATENRTGTITFKGFKSKITVKQYKYAVGDVYNENGVTGTVEKMDNGVNIITRKLETGVAWSTENVVTGANDLYDGRVNWEIITKIPGWKELYPAFALVDELNTGSVTGWYLLAPFEIDGNYPVNSYYEYKYAWFSAEKDNDEARCEEHEYFNQGYDIDWDYKNSQRYPIAAYRF